MTVTSDLSIKPEQWQLLLPVNAVFVVQRNLTLEVLWVVSWEARRGEGNSFIFLSSRVHLTIGF